jgi:hypothetical protein
MRTAIFYFNVILAMFIITGCGSSGGDGTSGGSGNYANVTYTVDEATQTATCYNANQNIRQNDLQTCIWNCALYQGAGPMSVIVYFEPISKCTGIGLDNDNNEICTEFTIVYSDSFIETGPCI